MKTNQLTAALVALTSLLNLSNLAMAENDLSSLDLARRRAIKEYIEKTFPKYEAAIKEAVTPEVKIVVDWEKLALEDHAEVYSDETFFDQPIFQPLITALKQVGKDDMGREALRSKLSKVHVTYNFETAPLSNYINGVTFEGGVLTINFAPYSNPGGPDSSNYQDRVKAIVTILEKGL